MMTTDPKLGTEEELLRSGSMAAEIKYVAVGAEVLLPFMSKARKVKEGLVATVVSVVVLYTPPRISSWRVGTAQRLDAPASARIGTTLRMRELMPPIEQYMCQ